MSVLQTSVKCDGVSNRAIILTAIARLLCYTAVCIKMCEHNEALHALVFFIWFVSCDVHLSSYLYICVCEGFFLDVLYTFSYNLFWQQCQLTLRLQVVVSRFITVHCVIHRWRF